MENLIEVKDLKKVFAEKAGMFGKPAREIKAVDGVSLSIPKGKVLGLVGESGCGKSTVGRTLLGLTPKTAGQIMFDGKDMDAMTKPELRTARRRMQMVFQDPFSSLDPRMNVAGIISEGMRMYHMYDTSEEIDEHVEELMLRCGLFPEQAYRYAHQFSGGQRQRICIARALATKPDFVVLDEAVSALDVSIQAQIINLLKDLQESEHLTYLFISHDLSVVRYISDEVAVMYLGQIVEYGKAEEVLSVPAHPYTKALLSAAPAFTREEKANKHRIILQGDVPSPSQLPRGCRFSGRCPLGRSECMETEPAWKDLGGGHFCRCPFADQ